MAVTNLFHFTTNLSGGGAETQMLLLVKGLSKSGYDHTIVFYKAEDSFPFEQYTEVKFISFEVFKEVFKNFKSENFILHIWIPDVFTYINPLFFRKYSRRTLVGVRNRYSLDSTKRIYQSLCFSLFKNIVSNTPKEIHSVLYKRIFGGNFIYIPNAIKYEIQDIDGIFNKNSEFLFVGRLVKQKGILDLVKAFHLIDNKNFSLEILGKGPLQAELNNLISNPAEAEINLRGFSQNPIRYFRDHKFLVLPSYYEGMPNVAFEALSQNCLLILSDIPQNRLWFSDKEVYYFQPGNIVQLKECLIKAYQLPLDRRVNMVHLAKEKLKILTVQNYIESYKNLYAKILDED